MEKKLTIKFKGLIPYVASSNSIKFNQKATLIRDYSDDTIVNEGERTEFKEPKFYAYGYLQCGFKKGTKKGWTLNLPKKGTSVEMVYHSQKFEEIKDLYWVFEGRVFPFPENATVEVKKVNEDFRIEYNLGRTIWSYGKKEFIVHNDSEYTSAETYYDKTIEKSNKYYVVYFGDNIDGLYEKSVITHSLPNAYLYARRYDVGSAVLAIIENGKVVNYDEIYPYSDDLQEVAKNWLKEYHNL